MNDTLQIVGLTLAACAGAGVVGAVGLHLLRHRALRQQLRLVVLVPVLAVAATLGVNVQYMFLSTHDSAVVLLALGLSSVLAVAAAWAVLRRVMKALTHLNEAVRQLVSEADPATSPTTPGPAAAVPVLPSDFAHLATELASTRQALAELRAREQSAENARRELVSFLSHDLRTPLSGLRAVAEALEDGLVTDVPRALAHLHGSVDRMSALVDDLFALSRVEGPTAPRPGALVSLAEVIGDVASELGATAAARSVELVVDVPAQDRLAVLGRADDLTRALANLVSNAVRHTDPGQAVRVQGRRAEDGRVQIAVVDGCGGIPVENLERVFDAGWRGSPERSGHGADGRGGSERGGGGLGLAIARGVVQSHDGRIAVSNVDGGCRFEVDLPALAP